MDRITATHAFPCEVTNYKIPEHGDHIVEDNRTDQIGAYIATYTGPEGQTEHWLILEVSCASMIVTSGSVQHTSTSGWMAQGGTAPVKINGRWGGKNYPEMFFTPESMRELWKTLAPDLLLPIA